MIGLVLVLTYIGKLSFFPFNTKIDASFLYFTVTFLLLPFFRYLHPYWFKSKNDQIITYKQKAMAFHHMDMQQNHHHGPWNVKGVNANPWEYTSNSTATYGNAAGWGFNLFSSIVMSTLFIIFAPIFVIIALVLKRMHKSH